MAPRYFFLFFVSLLNSFAFYTTLRIVPNFFVGALVALGASNMFLWYFSKDE